MRETPNSLRAYLIIAGLLVTGIALSTIVELGPGPLILLFHGVSMALGVGMFAAGIIAPRLLLTMPAALHILVWVSYGWRTIAIVVVVIAGIADTGTYIDAAIGTAIAIYLTLNIKRLSSQTLTLSPGARVMVTLAPGSRHPATVIQQRGQQTEVRFDNGHQQWIEPHQLT
jgi:hypothetical protein